MGGTSTVIEAEDMVELYNKIKVFETGCEPILFIDSIAVGYKIKKGYKLIGDGKSLAFYPKLRKEVTKRFIAVVHASK